VSDTGPFAHVLLPAAAVGCWPACSAAFRQPAGSSASASWHGTQPRDAEQDLQQTYQVEIGQHIAAVERDGMLLADAAQVAGLAASVPACPGWQVRDLVRHQAYVHAWAARHVAEQAAKIIGTADEADILSGGPPDADLIASYRDGVAALVRTLHAADPDVACATFLPAPSPLAFWARRQAHETAVHRFDAQAAGRAAGQAADPLTAFPPAFAADGIDELITGFAARRKRTGPGRSLLVRATDTADAWHYEWPADGQVRARRIGLESADAMRPGTGACGPGDGGLPASDCQLAGPASGGYLFLWNRCTAAEAGVEITGDPAILGTWNSGIRVRWS
jgi:uncharacterized protein (TIGR03083 family)